MNLLRYCEVKYACIHGGRKHTNRGTGKRKTCTFKKNCPCFVSFRIDEKGENLIVTNVNLDHANHELNEQLYQFYPKVRKLSDDEKSCAERMLAMKTKKKLLQHELENDTGKRVSLRDLTNIAVAAKRRSSTRNDLSACVDLLRNVYHCNVDICTSSDNGFCGITSPVKSKPGGGLPYNAAYVCAVGTKFTCKTGFLKKFSGRPYLPISRLITPPPPGIKTNR